MHEEVVTQMNRCISNSRPHHDLITMRFGMDESFGSCEAICVKYEGSRNVEDVKAIASLSRPLCQPHPTIRNDGEYSIGTTFRQTRVELQVEMQPVAPTVLKGSNGGLEQANKATEGMTRTIMSSWETRYEVRVPNGQPVVREHDRHAVWLWKRFQPGEDGLSRYCRQYQRWNFRSKW